MLDDDSGNGERIDVAEIVVHEDVAETADLPPRNRGKLLFELVGERLCRLRQGLKIAQRRVVEDVVLRDVPALTDAAYLGDRIEDVQRVSCQGLLTTRPPRLRHGAGCAG